MKFCYWLALLTVLFVPGGAYCQETRIEEVHVRVSAVDLDSSDFLSGYTTIDQDALQRTRHTHASELFVRVPGVWISRGSGQEHLTALRSGVLTGPGACGSVLFLEDGVPIRPQGFCNVNNLFETTLELSDAVEVLRGPAVASFRGNPLYGAINSMSLDSDGAPWLELESGSESYRGLRAASSAKRGVHQLQASAKLLATDGFRDSVSHREQKVKLIDRVSLGEWQSLTSLALTNLDQQTGGYVLGGNAYKSSELRRSNPNPEAYREAWSARLTSHWQREYGRASRLTLVPYARASRMEFLQHFLPGQPTEANGHTSIGVIGNWNRLRDSLETSLEAHLEWADLWLEEVQDNPTTGSAFLVATRPVGTHYDYDVSSLFASVSGRLVKSVTDRFNIQAGLRLEHLGYDYQNNWLDGNTRDDGSLCGFGGCLYTRPSSRDDEFTNLGGMLGFSLYLTDKAQFWMGAGSGFRAPQATELYRLQRGQLVADLDSERRDSLEAGVRWIGDRAQLEGSVYSARSRELIFRDAQGMNVSQGKTKSLGLEFEVSMHSDLLGSLELIGSWTKHRYDFDQTIGLGEVIASGKEIDTAPRFMGSGRWKLDWQERVASEVEITIIDEYWMNAQNTHQYGGHWLLNWRLDWQVRANLEVFLRITNLLDREYAHRADYAFGNQRYFPGLPRQVHVGFRLRG